jgi:hypothetical protein
MREGQQLLGGVAGQRLQLGELPSRHPHDDIQLLMDVAGVGWARIVRMAAATM